jgi:hypothetical protein
MRSQNGWTANRRDLCSWFRVPGTNVKLLLRTEYAGPLLVLVAQIVNARVEPIRDPGCWSYAERLVRGSSSSVSNHASGTAIDLNAPRHPLGRRGTFTPAQRAEIKAIERACGGAVRWGGSYQGRADEMHWEINTTDIAMLLEATRRLGVIVESLS